MTRADPKVAAALATTIVVWASAFVAIRAALHDYSAADLSVFRLLVASVALAALAPLLGVRRPARADVARFVGVALLGMTLYQLFLNTGERSVEAGTASVLVATAPVFVALLARFVRKEEVSALRWTGIAVAFAGAATIALGEGGRLSGGRGAAAVLAAAAVQAGFFFAQKPLLGRYSSFEVTAWAMWIGTLFLLPLAPSLAQSIPAAGAGATSSVLWLGVGASALGFLTWGYALARMDVTVATAALYLVPATTTVIAWLWLGEVPSTTAILGGVAVLVGVALVQAAPAVTGRLRSWRGSDSLVDVALRDRGGP